MLVRGPFWASQLFLVTTYTVYMATRNTTVIRVKQADANELRIAAGFLGIPLQEAVELAVKALKVAALETPR